MRRCVVARSSLAIAAPSFDVVASMPSMKAARFSSKCPFAADTPASAFIRDGTLTRGSEHKERIPVDKMIGKGDVLFDFIAQALNLPRY